MRLEPLRDRLRRPILVINDSPIKQFAENEHAVGQSALESYLRMTNRVTNGEQVTVFGYGACGRGVAANFRAARARVSVVDVDPVTRLRAHLDGFATPPRDAAIVSADVIITVTGARGVLTAADLGFALQARCLEAVARRHVDAASCVVPVPRPIDEAVARAYLDLKYPAEE
jgi:adenosylhomocysteinase